MPTYLRLVKTTPKGLANIKNVSGLRDANKRIIEGNGGKMLNVWATMGPYDFVALIEAPNNETMTKISALITAEGNIVGETIPAIPFDEFAKAMQ